MPRRLPLVLVLAAGLAAGCGGDDDGGGSASTSATTAAGAAGEPSKLAEDARVRGPEGKRIVSVTRQLLAAADGDEPCYAIAASDWVESQGGLEGCAKKLGPIATGPLDTVVAAGPVGDGKTGEAQVESADGSEKRTIKFARTVAGEWRIDGLDPP